MAREFIYSKPDGTPSRPAGFSRAMTVLDDRLKVGEGPWRIQLLDEDPGPERNQAETIQRMRRRVQAGDVGDKFRVRDPQGRVVYWVKEVKPALVVIDTTGNDKIDVVWSSIKQEFPHISYLGAYVCKTIAGSGGTMSQHSYGNAIDVGAGTMDQLWEIAKWAVARADQLKLEHVIVDDRIWTRGYGWRHYGGERHYHVHLDCNPQYSGPCGVRG